MNLMVMAITALAVIGVVFKLYYSKSIAFRTESAKVSNEIEALDTQLGELKQEEKEYARIIAECKVDLEDALGAEELERQEEVKRTVKRAKAPKTVIEVLLKRKHVSAEEVQKAEEYKRSTKSPLPVEQILLMFEQINPQQLQMAKDALKSK